MREIIALDECNDAYGRVRMYQALILRNSPCLTIPSEHTVYCVMGMSSERPLEKAVTDITEIKCKDSKPYVSAIFAYFDFTVLGLSMDTNMKALLCIRTVENAVMNYPGMRGAILHSDRGSQYTSEVYREALRKHQIART